MTHSAGHDRDQSLLLREAVDDYVVAHNPVRFIDAFVKGLDLAALGFARVVPEATGRPGYAPYGYLNRVRSSRRLEAETHRNVEVIWLAAAPEAGFQDDRRFPPRQPRGRRLRKKPRSLCVPV